MISLSVRGCRDVASVELDARWIVDELDEPCWQCVNWSSETVAACDLCHGRGYQLTDAGRALLAFLERWKD